MALGKFKHSIKITGVVRKNGIASGLVCCFIIGIVLFCSGAYTASSSVSANSSISSAVNITKECKITVSGNESSRLFLTDSSLSTKWGVSGDGFVGIESEQEIGSVYIEWAVVPDYWVLSVFNQNTYKAEKKCGEFGYINEFQSMEKPLRNIRLVWNKCDHAVSIARITVFSAGTVPDTVQKWEPTLQKADMLVLSTHADDEHLYFGGTIPTYAGEQHKKVQVSYLINHGISRTRELLAGLWVAGAKAYPVISDFPDIYAATYPAAQKVYSEKSVLEYQVGLLRRFKPDVVIGHDLNGEYGHGMHIMNAKTLTEAITAAQDASLFPESAALYGTWEVKKCYLHLYKENQITMDWNQPLSYFGGKTAWEVAKLAYDKHVSQHQFKFRVRIEGPNDCRLFGLYYSAVGPDVQKNDFFENINPDPTPSPIPVITLSFTPTPSGTLSHPSTADSVASGGSETTWQGWVGTIRTNPWSGMLLACVILVVAGGALISIFHRKNRK